MLRLHSRLILLALGALMFAAMLVGCGDAGKGGAESGGAGEDTSASSNASNSSTASPHSSDSNGSGSPLSAAPPTDPLAEARRLLQIGDVEGAARSASRALVKDPDSADAKLVAAEVEASRGNHELAAELAASIDLRSRLSERAVELQVAQWIKLGQTNRAADLLLAALDVMPHQEKWRHEAWQLLNRAGRREEASEQALALSREGLATEQELLSLISRGLTFPTPEMLQDDQGDRFFDDGLGKARWYYSMGDHRRALDELAPQRASGFESPAAEALYGRLLAERQQWDEFRAWSSAVSEPTKELADYWAAIGNFFVNQLRYEAAAKALLEAIRLDPTDRVSVQRLSRALYAIDRPDDGDQFKYRGVEISETEHEARALYVSPRNLEARKKLVRGVMELGRPFETLAWTASMIPPSASGPRQAIARQRAELRSDPKTLSMASESSLLGLDPNEFDMQSAWDELLSGDAEARGTSSVASRPISATPRLVNRAAQLGLDFQWYKDVEIDFESIPIHESLGGGIAVLDYDLDGWPDVYLAQGAGDPPTDRCTRSNQLFRHGIDAFTDVTQGAGAEDFHYSSGLAAGDVNQDGFPDLYLGSLGHNRLLINNGDGSFRDATQQLGDGPDRFTASVGIADIDGDGLPDLFESNYIEMEGGFALPREGPDGRLLTPTPLRHFADSDRWLKNLGDGRFELHEIGRDVAKPGTSLGLVITDFDSDGRNEVFVGNDVRPNHYLVQAKDGNGFVNLADFNGLANGFDGVANGCMGIATGDFNRDGRFDMQIANYTKESANLYLQTPRGDFRDDAVRYGLADPTRPMVGFGTKASDFDRNGFPDFIITNGHIFDMQHLGEPFRMPPQVLMFDGRRLQETEVEDDSEYWQGTYLGRSIAMLDYDRDGALDFLIGHLDAPLALLHDETEPPGSWLQLELVGTRSERDAIGAKVVLTVGDSTYTAWVTGGDGYFSSDEPLVAFGFPETDLPARVEVQWPSGERQVVSDLQCGRRYLIVEGEDQPHRRERIGEN